MNQELQKEKPEKIRTGIGRLAFLAWFVVWAVVATVARDIGGDETGNLLWLVANLLILLPACASRFDNIGRSPWWCLLCLVPGLGLLVAIHCLILPPGHTQRKNTELPEKIATNIDNNMKTNNYEVMIPEGKELQGGYVALAHNTQYSLILLNHSNLRCDAEILIDGIKVGTWRVEKEGKIRIERPVHDTGRFTFFVAGTPEAKAASIGNGPQMGLISVKFIPEVEPPMALYSSSPLAPGGTGLTGESRQKFVDASRIERDEARSFIIHLRLVAEEQSIRPLAPRSTPVPPPIG